MAHKGYTLRSGRRVLGTIHPTSDRGVYRWRSNFTKDGGVTSSLGNAERLLIKEAGMTLRQYEISLVDNETGKSRPASPTSPSRDASSRTLRYASKTRQANDFFYRAKKAETDGERATAAIWYKKAAAALAQAGGDSKRVRYWRAKAQHLSRRRAVLSSKRRTSRDASRKHTPHGNAGANPMKRNEQSTRAWELWSRAGREDHFIQAFFDKGNAQRRMAKLKKVHPDVHYYFKHRASPSRMHFERRGSHRAAKAQRRTSRDATRRRFLSYEKGREELRGGYTVTWRPHGAFVQWYLRTPAGKVLAYGPARDDEQAIAMAKHALYSHQAAPNARIPHRRSEFTTREQHYSDRARRSSRDRKKGLNPFEAKEILRKAHAPLDGDFHELRSSQVQELLDAAIEHGYRKPANANGSRARSFHTYLQRAARR